MSNLSRRTLLAASGAAAALSTLSSHAEEPAIKNGRLKQSVCQWCFGSIPLAKLAGAAAGMGLKSVELVEPKDWPTLKEHGLICAMTPSHSLTKGLNHVENHAECLEKLRTAIEATSAAGFPNVITFSGNRNGIDDETGIKNCVKALKEVIGLAEKKNVTLCMELLNSRVDHHDYQCDRVEWGVEVCKGVGSDRMKLLFDIYHMQIMEGDIIHRIRQFKDYLGHYHTAGVPGRNELDENQELYYPAIMRAIVATGFTGYVAQEFIPKAPDKLASLRAAVSLCDV